MLSNERQGQHLNIISVHSDQNLAQITKNLKYEPHIIVSICQLNVLFKKPDFYFLQVLIYFFMAMLLINRKQHLSTVVIHLEEWPKMPHPGKLFDHLYKV